MIDVVWKISSNGKWGQHECLRYSIRSVVKNFKDLGKICIVGTKPEWASDEIYHIPAEDIYKKNKDASIIEKLILACKDNSLSSNIINISDDQLIIHPINSSFLRPFTIDSDLRRMSSKKGISKYGLRVQNTISALKKNGITNPHCYEIHCPVLINKQKYIEVMQKFDYSRGVGMVGNSLYFNSITNNGEYPIENYRAFFKRNPTTSQIISECRGKLFLGYQRRALNKNLKEYLKQRFPDKSIYEK